MLNIKICGYAEDKEREIKEVIDEAIQQLGLQEDAITSIVSLRAESCDGKKTSMPYIKVTSAHQTKIERIIEKLKELGIKQDVEWSLIGGFIPAEKMVPKSLAKSFDRGQLTCCWEGADSKCEPNKRPPGYCNGCGG